MLRRFDGKEDGQMLVFTAISLTMLMGFMALAIDVGLLFRARRQAQTAADAAAIAAALQLEYVGTGAATAAQNAAGSNGIPNPSTNVTVNVYPNITSPYHSNVGYVQAVVQNPNTTYFLSAFKALRTTLTVSASAIAGTTPGPACIYVLDNTSKDTDVLYSQGTVTATNCGIQVNSPNAKATCDHGSGNINGPYLHIVGGQDTSGGCKANLNTPVTTGLASTGDPLNLPFPNSSTSKDCPSSNTFSGGTLTNASQLPPAKAASDGVASDAITCFSGNVTLSNVTLGPGVYVFKSGVNISGNVTVNGGTLDIDGGSFSNQNGNLSITAPANRSATYNGIAIMQPTTNTTSQCQDSSLKMKPCLQTQFGSSNQALDGLIYAPGATVYLQDEGGGVTAAGIVAWNIYNKSALTILNSYSNANPSTTPLTTVSLVE
jgi:Flp pilus assembly protein TadG